MPDSARLRAAQVPVHAMQMPDMTEELRARLDHLETMAETRERAELSYRDEAGKASLRVVRPLGLFFWGKVWTLVAWCELRNDFRMFRIDRIAGMKEAGRFRAERDKSLTAFYARMRAEGAHRSS